jgi:hypothetical protein
MKQKLWIVLVVSVLVLASGGRLYSLDVGVKAGLSKVSFKLSSEIPGLTLNARSEFIIGAFVSIDLLKFLAVQPEINYLTKGVDTTEGDEFGEWEFTYLEIPVLMKFKIPVKGKIQPAVFLGPYLAFNTKAWVTETEAGEVEEVDLEDFAKSPDYGLVFGGCVEYTLGFGKLILDVRYSMGLTSCLKNLMILTGGDLMDDDSVKNRVFALTAGFAF